VQQVGERTGLDALVRHLRAQRAAPSSEAALGCAVEGVSDVTGSQRVAVLLIGRDERARAVRQRGLPDAGDWHASAPELPGAAALVVGEGFEPGHGLLPAGWPPPVHGASIDSAEHPRGVLYTFDGGITRAGMAAAEVIASHLGAVLDRFELAGQLAASTAHTHQLLELTSEIARRLEFSTLAQRIVDGITELTDFRVALMTLRDGDLCRRLACSGSEDARIGLETPFEKWEGLLQPEWLRGELSYLIPPEAPVEWSDVPDIAPSDDPDAWSADHALITKLLDGDGQIVGFLSVDEPHSGRLPDDDQVEQLELYARQVQVAFVNARLYDVARQAAERDSLTGLRNRRMLWADLEELLSSSGTFTVAVMDIDDFKDVNDQHGHAVGDQALRHVADRLVRSTRHTDRTYRVGGEEFVVLLPGSGAAEAREVLDRAAAAVGTARDAAPAVTLSTGLAEHPRHGRTGDALFNAADKAMYVAKRAGKGRVVLAD
jgi:diguanylate cyclase (GGDEF)-like protein